MFGINSRAASIDGGTNSELGHGLVPPPREASLYVEPNAHESYSDQTDDEDRRENAWSIEILRDLAIADR